MNPRIVKCMKQIRLVRHITNKLFFLLNHAERINDRGMGVFADKCLWCGVMLCVLNIFWVVSELSDSLLLKMFFRTRSAGVSSHLPLAGDPPPLLSSERGISQAKDQAKMPESGAQGGDRKLSISTRHVLGSQPHFTLISDSEQNNEDTSCISAVAYDVYIPLSRPIQLCFTKSKFRKMPKIL